MNKCYLIGKVKEDVQENEKSIYLYMCIKISIVIQQKRFMRMGNRRSQAALEFLTTYAWAFLVILIMVGALAYFGILSPSKLLPDRCNFGSEINCIDYAIGLTTLDLRLKNNVGEAIVVDSFSASSESTTAYGCIPPITPFTWNGGDIQDLSFSGCDGAGVGFVVGEKGKVSVTIGYHLAKSSSTYSHEVSGEVFATVT